MVILVVPHASGAEQVAPQDGRPTGAGSARTVSATRLTAPIRIDGQLNDPAWVVVPFTAGFIQREPDEGRPATENTAVRVGYDEAAVYIGVRLWDSQPSQIGRQLARRDNGAEADRVTVYLDPYHDRRTGALFEVSAAGVQRDGLIYDDYRTDDEWDAVWESAVHVDAEGWSAEIRIPLSQVRFNESREQVWGINVSRYLLRRAEETWLEVMPRNSRWLASRMATLEGLERLAPTSHVEILPYASARGSFIAPDVGDPFNNGRQGAADVGADAKWSPSSNLTLNATFRPDFGQVEVDPSVINLTDFETFFEEKRPFFLEGSSIFEAATGDSLFYSRRIGREPQLSAGGDHASVPAAATILGAAKLTGKVRGWTFGLLEAVTNKVVADVETEGALSRVEVEPLTNYFVGRAKFDRQRGGIGLSATAVQRDLATSDALSRLVAQAYAVGTDGYAYLDGGRAWKVTGQFEGSLIQGDAAAITRQQRSSRRYFQRPDATHVQLDPEATSLGGWRGLVEFGRQRGSLQVEAAVQAISPGFEINDLGFQGRSDSFETEVALSWTSYSTNRWSRRRSIEVSKDDSWNFARQRLDHSWGVSTSVTFLNYWYVSADVSADRQVFDDGLTRGGPLALSPPESSLYLSIGSDSRKPVSFYLGPYWSTGKAGWERGASVGIVWRPANTVTLDLSPKYYNAKDAAQFLTAVTDQTAVGTLGARYVFAPIETRQFSIEARLDMTLTPRLSVQTYIEPFVAVGTYGGPMELARPRSFDFLRYGVDQGRLTPEPAAGRVNVDPDGDGPAPSFRISGRDYNSKSLTTKAVLRWEWRPGSTFYLAWTQRKRDGAHPGSWDLGRDTRLLFRAPADDVVLMKVAYWFGR
jgi:hypothetical protein